MSEKEHKVAIDAEGKPTYWLDRNFLASGRLSYQHYIYRDRFGYILHPDIKNAVGLAENGPKDSSLPIQILDLATGNGIWALDLARQVANAKRHVEIIGLDISDAMFPAKQSCPENVTFDTWDLLTDPPTHYKEKFDLIHIRFIIPVMWQSPTLREKAIKNFTQMLKPGGYLQWVEPSPPTFVPVTFDADGEMVIGKRSIKAFEILDNYIPVQRNTQWLKELDKFMAESGGYLDTKAYFPEFKKDQLTFENILIRWNATEAIPQLMKSPLPEGVKKELDIAFKELFDGIDSGQELHAGNYVVALGRKPS